MRWYLANSLMYDSKIIILISLIVTAILFSGLLIFFERKTKKKTAIKEKSNKLKSEIDKLKDEISNSKEYTTKLSIMDKYAKELFNKNFELSTKKGYSSLIQFFDEKRLPDYADFCRSMFLLYYSTDNVSDGKIIEARDLLIKLIQNAKNNTNLIKEDNLKKIVANEKGKYEIDLERILAKKEKKNLRVSLPLIDFKKSQKEIDELLKLKNIQLTSEQKKLVKQLKEKQNQLEEQQNRNLELLKETENRIKEQEKLEIELGRRLEGQKKKEDLIEARLKKEKLIEQERIIQKQIEENDKSWYEKVDVEPMIGKDWLKEFRKKRREGLI